MAPTVEALVYRHQRKAAAMLVDLGTGIGVADGALSLAGCVCRLLAPYRVEAENICWTYRDAEGQWGSFELRDRAVVFGQVPRQSEYGAIDFAIDFAMDFLGHKGAAPIDLVGLAMKGQEQRLAEVEPALALRRGPAPALTSVPSWRHPHPGWEWRLETERARRTGAAGYQSGRGVYATEALMRSSNEAPTQ